MPGTPAIDRAALARLLGSDDRDFIDTLLAHFAEATREYGAQLASAVAGGDLEASRRLAHMLSGSSRTICAAGLAQAAAELEAACGAGSANLASLHAALGRELARVLAEIGGAPGGAS